MPESAKARLTKMRRMLAIPREVYLQAVQRQEHRAWAHRTDPRTWFETRTRVVEIKNAYFLEEGEDPEPLPDPDLVEDPDPAVFDTEEEMKRDDMVIDAYLADNPLEPRKPNARGHTHADLRDYWYSSPEGVKWRENKRREDTPRLIELRDRFLAKDKSKG